VKCVYGSSLDINCGQPVPSIGLRIKAMPSCLRLCLIVLLLAFSGTAFADSDGYYCVGRGFIAYQFGFAAPPARQHRVYVISFGPSGMTSPAVLELPQFQVHGMLCANQVIQIAAYDAIYTVHLDSMNRPTDYETTPWADQQNTPPAFVGHSLNLGACAIATGRPRSASCLRPCLTEAVMFLRLFLAPSPSVAGLSPAQSAGLTETAARYSDERCFAGRLRGLVRLVISVESRCQILTTSSTSTAAGAARSLAG
jgi:hypothetical protein